MDGCHSGTVEQIEYRHSGIQLEASAAYLGSMLLADITPQHIGKYQGIRQKEKASNRTINMAVSTLRMMMKASRLWGAISEDVRMLQERRDIGRVLTPDEESACSILAGRAPSPAFTRR